MKYRKKPVVIEAVRFNGTRNWDNVTSWLIEATQKPIEQEGSLYVVMLPNEEGFCTIHTREGMMKGCAGDYIIRGIQGEIYPCKPDIFEATYERVD